MQYSGFKNRRGEALDTSFHAGTKNNVLVILGHGVTGNKDRPLLMAIAEGLSKLGWPCLRLSFSGCGASQGKFADSNISKNSNDLEDIISAIPENVQIIYCGHSMGGAVGALTTAKNPRIKIFVSLAGMVQTAKFYNAEFGGQTPGESNMWGEAQFPLSLAYKEDLLKIADTRSFIKKISRPLLFIHGTSDDVVLMADSELAYQEANEPKRLVVYPEADHAFGEKFHAAIVKEIAAWIDGNSNVFGI